MITISNITMSKALLSCLLLLLLYLAIICALFIHLFTFAKEGFRLRTPTTVFASSNFATVQNITLAVQHTNAKAALTIPSPSVLQGFSSTFFPPKPWMDTISQLTGVNSFTTVTLTGKSWWRSKGDLGRGRRQSVSRCRRDGGFIVQF